MKQNINRIKGDNSWENVQRRREVKHKLARGREYKLFYVIKKYGYQKRCIKRSFRLIELYKHHILVESPLGIRQCFTYWEFFKRLHRNR